MKCHAMGELAAARILRMLDGGGADVLCHMTVEGHHDSLYSPADAQDRNLTVIRQSGDEHFRQVAFGIDAVQLG